MSLRNRGLILGATLFVGVQAGPALAGVHTIQPGVKLYQAPGAASKVLARLDHNQTLKNIDRQGSWLKVRTRTGRVGYVLQRFISRVWIKVYKQERRLYLMRDGRVVKTYRIALSPTNPLGDKIRQGDAATPEGRFFLCEMIPRPQAARYGARSLRLSYPNIEDARRGLRQRLISYRAFRAIVRAIRAGKTPPQNTKLGGSIRIHGGGSKRDWTLGCIALEDRDVIDLYARVRPGVRVEVYRSAAVDRRLNSPGYLGRLVLAGARAQVAARAYYSSRATAEFRLKFPGGDIPRDWAVCTDVIIRALRRAGI
ncbi:MAG: DUF1287 domain-containing protein, partial [Proteobacteria bacterium]|nr:DUF1287 domain-containing protein [Pseudomonadota bacterium]